MGNLAGDFVRRERKSRSWGVRQLARESGLSHAYISQIESGKRPATMRAIALIAKALGLKPYEALVQAGLIPTEDLLRAQEMASRAADSMPPVEGPHREEGDADRRERLLVDYLRALGYEPDAPDFAAQPVRPHYDWRALDPNALEPRAAYVRKELAAILSEQEREPVPVLEGWDELSDDDRMSIQHMVNRLRRSTAGE